MKVNYRRIVCFLMACVLFAGVIYVAPAKAGGSAACKTSPDCKTLSVYALKASGGSEKLKYKSKSSMDFGALSSSDRSRIKHIMYVCDAKEVYSLCVARTSSKQAAAKLVQSLKKYIKNNNKSDYLSDYSADEKKVLKNAICGKKGKYVWYIAMSPDKNNNKKGEKALKKKL